MEHRLDVRDLEPCEPLERTLEALQQLERGDQLTVLHRREPHLLYPLLEKAGFTWSTQTGTDTPFLVPVLSLWDLGVLQDVERRGTKVIVTITPTYSGCPAMETMKADIERVLRDAGIRTYEVRTRLAPAWSSSWISPEGGDKLRSYGIAPPGDGKCDSDGLTAESGVACPRCGSDDTRCISEFGSTACKALFQCNRCSEPFDYFKAI